jgi:1-acyl-sn-glycerol-3-phosphate acyltransferase
LIRSLNAFPVKRGAGDTSAVRLALEKLAEGHCLIMFPEGTRGDGVTLGPMQNGVAMLAKRSGAQVVPVGVYGTHKILPKGRKLPGFSRLRVAFGVPFTYAETATAGEERQNRALFAQRLEKEIVEQCRRAGLEVRTSPTREDRQ